MLGWSTANSSWYEAKLFHDFKIIDNNKSPIEQRRRNSRSPTDERSIEHFEFVFLLVIFSKILGAIDLALKYFPYEKADLCLAIDRLENVGLLKTTTGY